MGQPNRPANHRYVAKLSPDPKATTARTNPRSTIATGRAPMLPVGEGTTNPGGGQGFSAAMINARRPALKPSSRPSMGEGASDRFGNGNCQPECRRGQVDAQTDACARRSTAGCR